MSNVTVFNPSQVPAFARNRGELSPMAKALAGGAGGGGKRISIKGGVFRLISGGKEVASIEDRHLDVVIVNAAPKVSRVWYGKTYDATAAVAPVPIYKISRRDGSGRVSELSALVFTPVPLRCDRRKRRFRLGFRL